jgi:non-lysosomal glucosylceramidase
MDLNQSKSDSCKSTACGCGSGIPRRDFLAMLGAGALTTLAAKLPVMAGPFADADFDKLVPADKKLDPKWVKSLFARGEPTVYRGANLKYIGMPIGGITTGQLYLGGDGRLWHWDIFNRIASTGADHYAHPVDPQSPLRQGFSLAIDSAGQRIVKSLDARGFPDVAFTGQYPIGTVEYREVACPIAVTLEAFSPFIPLDVADSSLPATVLHFTLMNISDKPLEAELIGHLENAVALYSGDVGGGTRRNQISRDGRMLLLHCSAVPAERPTTGPTREQIVFEDFEGENYGKWTVEGTAFGKGPAKGAPAPDQKLTGYLGKSLADSWLSSDEPKGKLTSPDFKIERRYINFLIAGGRHPRETCINLVIDGNLVRSETGKDTDIMEWASWDVQDLAQKAAHIEILDQATGGWGHIEIDQIEFSDTPRRSFRALAEQPDFGTMALALLAPGDADQGITAVAIDPAGGLTDENLDAGPFGQTLIGALSRKVSLQPGESKTATFVLTWCFPNLELRGIKGGAGRHYATRFKSAGEAAAYVAANFERLDSQTRLWRDTWYNSTLPHWLLDRTLLNASILATSTAYRFANGRFYGWEGVGCCEGTCTHVWHYEQAMGRLFPELDILLRERADFDPDIAFHRDGMIDHRGEFHAGQAVAGQAGVILRAYRDHQMSVDDSFLRHNYGAIKRAMQWLIAQDSLDGKDDGIIQGAQHNTLDAEWYGPVAWLSGLYLASLRAAELMAVEMQDNDFAAQCRGIFKVGQEKFVATLFDGEYFINKPDPKRPDSINSGSGCEIDQVFGQSWAFQVGLGRVVPESQTRSALQALWKYNFSPDVGVYRKVNKPGRWYAMPGEAGLLMCTFPRSDWSYEKAKGKGPQWATGYFNECMNGFEHQVAGHMIWEGMVQEGLAVERALHDRYDAARRNPWNEVECGDHYARSMASYGVFIAACGFEYHGPKGYLAFAPRLAPENFKCAFTCAQGWGTFSQQIDQGSHKAQIALKSGKLQVRTLSLTTPASLTPKSVAATLSGKPVRVTYAVEERKIDMAFPADTVILAGQQIDIWIA